MGGAEPPQGVAPPSHRPSAERTLSSSKTLSSSNTSSSASFPRHLPSAHVSGSSWSLKQMESHSLSSYDFLTLPAKISSGFIHTVACARTALLNNILLLVCALSSLYVHRHLGGFHLLTVGITTAAMYLDIQISMSPEFSQNPLLSLFH